MGKSENSGGGRKASDAAQAQVRLAERMINQSDPTRELLYQDSNNFLRGNYDVGGTPQFQAAKAVAEPQYQRARDSIIASTPEGGALTQALADLEMGRARTLTDVSGGISQDSMNRAVQLGTFGAAQGSQNYGNAAMVQGMLAQNAAAENSAKAGALGSAAGSYLGTK